MHSLVGSQHFTLSQESPLATVVPKPSEQRSSATMRTKAKKVLISQTCNNAYKSKKGTDLSDLQQCVQRLKKRSTDLSDLSLNRMAG